MARFGLVGDLCGKNGWLKLAVDGFDEVGGVDAVLQTGNFGILRGERFKDPIAKADAVEAMLAERDLVLVFTPGNEDDWETLFSFEVGSDGIRKIREHIWLLHGQCITLFDARIGALGGATSSNRAEKLLYQADLRNPDCWWPQERVDRDLAQAIIKDARLHAVDILLTHEAPLICEKHFTDLKADFRGYETQAQIDRLIISDLHEQLVPRLHITGHHGVRHNLRPGRNTRLAMMGSVPQRLGLAAIYDTDKGTLVNVSLEGF